jgi:hypothetical protein
MKRERSAVQWAVSGFFLFCLGSDDDVLTQAVDMGNVMQRARCSHGEVPIARDFVRDDLWRKAHRHGA